MIELIENKSRKEHIQEVAEKLFREKGYTATSMRLLAASLGIEPASLYSHIKSKEEILETICFSMAAQFFNSILEIKNNTLPADTKLRAFILAHIKVVLNNINASAVFFHDWKHLSSPAKENFVEMRKTYEQEFRKVLKQGMDENTFKVNDINFTVLTIFSALNMTHEWYKSNGKWQSDEIGNKLADLLINGIAKK